MTCQRAPGRKNNDMRVILCGSGDFGIPTLRALAARHDVAGVMTQPPRRAGRGGKLRATPVAAAAEELHLPVSAVEDINDPDQVAAMGRLAPEAIVVIDFGQKVLAAARETAALEAINLHGSLLPALRGAAPVNWAIIRGHGATGVTTFRLVDRMDAGPVFVQRRTDIGPDETAEELRRRLADLGVEAVLETLERLAAGEQGRPQDESAVTAAPRLTKGDGRIDFADDAVSIRNRIHGTWPWPTAQARYVAADGKAAGVQIARAAALDTDCGDAQPGDILDDLTVATGAARLEIRQIKPAGKRLMDWRDFANGYRAGPGARFTATP